MTRRAVRSRVQLTFRQTGMYAPPSFCKRRMRTSVVPGLSFVTALRKCIRLQLRPTIHGNTCPVIHRAPSEARNAVTSATSSDLPILLSDRMLSARSRPASVLVKLDISVSIILAQRRSHGRHVSLTARHSVARGITQLQRFETASGASGDG